jgi:hypothetical protein
MKVELTHDALVPDQPGHRNQVQGFSVDLRLFGTNRPSAPARKALSLWKAVAEDEV